MWYDIELRSNNQRHVSGSVQIWQHDNKLLRHRCYSQPHHNHTIYDSQQSQFHYDRYAKGDTSIRISSKFLLPIEDE